MERSTHWEPAGSSSRPNSGGLCTVGTGRSVHSREANGDASHFQNNRGDLSHGRPPVGAGGVGSGDTGGEAQDVNNQGAGDSTNGASDARGPGQTGDTHAGDTLNGASVARSNIHGAADADGARNVNLNDPAAETPLSDEVSGATDALGNHHGATDAHAQNNRDDLNYDRPPSSAGDANAVDTRSGTHDDNHGAVDSTNGASDARGPGHAIDATDGASVARSNTHGASVANRTRNASLNGTTAESHLSRGADGDADALSNHNGAPDANGIALTSSDTPPIAQPASGVENGAAGSNAGCGSGAAPRGLHHGQQGRRTRGGARARRRAGLPPPQLPLTATASFLINRIIASLPYLSTLNTRQIGTHTWSD